MKVGIDLVAVRRFENLKSGAAVLQRVFTKKEREYCRIFKDPAPHFAGIFAAKEAASKALGAVRFPVLSLEVRHGAHGEPILYARKGKKLPASVSISHEEGFAVAMVAANF